MDEMFYKMSNTAIKSLLVGGVEVEYDAVMAHEFNIYFPRECG